MKKPIPHTHARDPAQRGDRPLVQSKPRSLNFHMIPGEPPRVSYNFSRGEGDKWPISIEAGGSTIAISLDQFRQMLFDARDVAAVAVDLGVVHPEYFTQPNEPSERVSNAGGRADG